MSRCGFSWTHSDEAPSKQGDSVSNFLFIFPRIESRRLRNYPPFVYFRANSASEFDFAVIYHRFFLLRITKIESKIVETMLWTSKQASEEEEFWNQSCERGKKKKKYVRMKSGKKKIGKILWGKPPLRKNSRVKEGFHEILFTTHAQPSWDRLRIGKTTFWRFLNRE